MMRDLIIAYLALMAMLLLVTDAFGPRLIVTVSAEVEAAAQRVIQENHDDRHDEPH